LLLTQGSQSQPLLFVFLVVAAATAGRLTSGCLPAAVLQWSVPARRRFLCGVAFHNSHNNFLYASLSLSVWLLLVRLLLLLQRLFFLSFWFFCVAFYLAVFDLAGTECVCVFSVCFFVAFWRSENGRTQRSGHGCV
jgi:hypothetical protein